MSLVWTRNRQDADFGETEGNVKEMKNNTLTRKEEPYSWTLIRQSMGEKSYWN